jgi:hypothetical protein
VSRRPAHAGRLPLWERLAFGVVFALMAAFVVAMTMSAAKSGKHSGNDAGVAAGSIPPPGPVVSDQVTPASASASPGRGARPKSAGTPADHRATQLRLNRRLAAALRPVIHGSGGRIAVGVIDASTGAQALYGASRHFHTASIERVDILAALLLAQQKAGTQLTEQQAQLVAPMIESGDSEAAAALWRLDRSSLRLAAANSDLGLAHTVLAPSGSLSLTKTTVTDQLRLLTDLSASGSRLNSASRDYEIGLMEDVQASQRWGVSAAASPGTVPAVADGWERSATLWVTNSIGIVDHGGQQLLIVVMASEMPSKAAGVAADSAAALAAAKVVTQPG